MPREGRRGCMGACRAQALPFLAMVGLAVPVPGRRPCARVGACDACCGPREGRGAFPNASRGPRERAGASRAQALPILAMVGLS